MFWGTLAQNILAVFIGCGTFTPNDQDMIICWSTSSLKRIEYLPHTTVISIFEPSAKQILKNADFINLPNLKNLNLNSAINGIEDGALYGLKSLVSFYCEDCDIPVVKANFFNNPNLTVVTFLKSNVRDIEEGVFSKLPNIRDVVIEENHIPVIKRGVFSNTNVHDIYLKSNKIEVIEDGGFYNMKHLKHVTLRHNLLKEFDSIKLFEKSLTVDLLRLDDNKLTKITKNTMSALPNLIYFEVHENEIETIENNSFYNLQQLHTVVLSHNRIRELKPEMINGNNNVTYLFLHGNYLSYISDEFLMKLPMLEGITTIGNPWQCACKNDLISYMKKHNIKDKCIDIDTLKCISFGNSVCRHDVELSQSVNVTLSSENCSKTYWKY